MDGSQVDTKPGFIKTNGMKFPKDATFMTGRVRSLMKDGKIGGQDAKNLLRVVRDDDVVVELASGVGYSSTLMATKRNIKSIHTFEPNPALVPYIQSVHAANDVENATVTNAFLGKRKSTVDFHMRGNVFASSTESNEGSTVVSTEKVDVLNAKTTLKDIKPTVLICNVEGAEAELIPELDLTTLRAAVVTLHPKTTGPEGVNAVFGAMMAAGLAYYARGSKGDTVAFRRSW